MRLPSLSVRLDKMQRDLLLLLLASIALVVALTAGVVHGGAVNHGFNIGSYLPLALVAVAALFTAVALGGAALRARTQVGLADDQAKELRLRLATAEALIRAEPQVLMYWEHGHAPKVVAHTLTSVPGLPTFEAELFRLNMWLDQRSTAHLREALDTLFSEGRAFNIIVRTEAGGHLEADGRAAGARAVLRLRDVAGYRRELSVIGDRQSALARDIRTSRALLDALPMPVWLRGSDGRITWVNKAYATAADARDESEVRQRQIELLETRQRKAIERSLSKSQVYRDRLPLIVGGERKSHDVTVITMPEATAGLAIDVAAIERAQSELDRQASSYERTLDRVATAIAIFGPDQRLTFFNDGYLKLWQLDANWLKSGPTDGAILDRLREMGLLPEVVHYRDWKAKLLTCYANGQAFESGWNLPDGRFVHVTGEQRPDGGVTYLYADETERYELESRYNALISVQRETLDSLKEGVAVFGTDGRLKLFNAAFASIWKQSRRALELGPHVEIFIRDCSVLCDDLNAWESLSRAVTAFTGQREQVEGQMVRPDNSVIDYAASPLPDGGTLLTFADVTDRRGYERALIERNEALVAADKVKSQFISNVSYELRTPLTNIIGFSEMLASPFFGPLSDKQREYLDDIMSSSRTLLSIIDDILDLATIDAGTLELKLAAVQVRDVIKAAIGGVRDVAVRSKLTLDIAVEDGATEFVADEDRVRQVLFNLLSNAVGFSPVGGVIHVSCWREDGYMTFSVEDQGIGIPREQHEKVLERFETSSRGSKHRGAGLGLSIVKHLVDLHGGRMTLESEPGTGTRVTVRFPERGIGHARVEADTRHASRVAGH